MRTNRLPRLAAASARPKSANAGFSGERRSVLGFTNSLRAWKARYQAGQGEGQKLPQAGAAS
jgi:hypothetical protein